jgi:hypothetical protein
MKTIGTGLCVFLLVLAAGCAPGGAVMTEQGFAGTWRLNREQSDLPPVTQSQVLVIETDGVFVRMRETLINDQDETLTISFDGEGNSLTSQGVFERVEARQESGDALLNSGPK